MKKLLRAILIGLGLFGGPALAADISGDPVRITSGHLQTGIAGTAGRVRIMAADAKYVDVQVPEGMAANWAMTLPPDDGTAGQFLKTNGAGVTSWDTPAGSTNYWQRTGVILSPVTGGDYVEVIADVPDFDEAIRGEVTGADIEAGVVGENSGSGAFGYGVVGLSGNSGGTGVYGFHSGTGDGLGVLGETTSDDNASYGGYFLRGGTDNAGLFGEVIDQPALGTPPAAPNSAVWRSYFAAQGPYIVDSSANYYSLMDSMRKNSTGSIYTRHRLNLIEGSNVTLTFNDDAGNDEVDVTISAAGGGGTMDDFALAGDVGTPQTIADADTLSILGNSTGIDTTVSATDTVTVAFDQSEVTSFTALTDIGGTSNLNISTGTTNGDTVKIRARATTGGTWVDLVTATAAALAPTLDFPTGATWNSNYIYHASGTDVALADGGTNASTAAQALINLGAGPPHSSILLPIMPKVDNTQVCSGVSNTTYAIYLGKCPKACTSFVIRVRTTTAYGTGGASPWAEVGIAIGTPSAAANPSLTVLGTTDVSGTYNAVAGNKSTTITATAAAGDDIWFLHGSKGSTPYLLRGCRSDELGGGGFASLTTSGPISALAANTTFTINTSASPGYVQVFPQ